MASSSNGAGDIQGEGERRREYTNAEHGDFLRSERAHRKQHEATIQAMQENQATQTSTLELLQKSI
ncbi:hypothetical protein IFR05_017453, partial [Cadophora sp. M221]